MIMRVKRGNTPVAFNGRTFDDLTDRKPFSPFIYSFLILALDQILADPLATPDRLPYGELVKFMGSENVPPEKDVLSFYGKVRKRPYKPTKNRNFSIVSTIFPFSATLSWWQMWAMPSILGMFSIIFFCYSIPHYRLSAHKHSCRPDCVTVFLGTKAVLKAIDPTTKKYNKDVSFTRFTSFSSVPMAKFLQGGSVNEKPKV